ncbi:MAG: hypothetical protein LBU99_03870 [Spirochaetaceae bacterium]|nr:hypothetical protein [Spirochaetaceae bacterium]
MAIRAMDLYDAYNQNRLPKDHGYIVSSFFSPASAYSIYEIVSYAAVKSFYLTGEGITFQTNGKKMYVLVEPSSYNQKAVEPYVRSSKDKIPLRFNDLNIYTTKNQYRVMYNKIPQDVMTSFTVLKPEGMNFAFIFYMIPEVYDVMALFFEKTLNREANVPLIDAKKLAKLISSTIHETMEIKQN